MIEHFNFWCHKILPLVYDESLSYYEVLCKFRAKLNEMVTAINEQNTTIEEFTRMVTEWEEEVEQKIDEKIEEGLEDLEERLETEFEQWFDTFQTTSESSVTSMLNSYTAEFNTELASIQSDFNSAMATFTNTFNAWFAEQEQTIQDTVEQYADQYMEGLDQRVSSIEDELHSEDGLEDAVDANTTAIGIINSTLNHLMECEIIGAVSPVPISYTGYEIHWNEYDFIIAEALVWQSSCATAIYSHDRFAGTSYNSIDLYLRDPINNTTYAFSKVDNTHIGVRSSGDHANEVNYSIRFYGIKIKGN